MTIRNRTRDEIRQSALVEFDVLVRTQRAEVRQAARYERKWDVDTAEWIKSARDAKHERKKHRKQLKAEKILRRMENLKLEDGKNMVVPEAVRAPRRVEA